MQGGRFRRDDPILHQGVKSMLKSTLTLNDEERERQIKRLLILFDYKELVPPGFTPTEAELREAESMQAQFEELARPRAEALVAEYEHLRLSDVQEGDYRLLPGGSIPDNPRVYGDEYYEEAWFRSNASFSIGGHVVHFRFSSKRHPSLSRRIERLRGEAEMSAYNIGQYYLRLAASR